jgi:hypothetical protein
MNYHAALDKPLVQGLFRIPEERGHLAVHTLVLQSNCDLGEKRLGARRLKVVYYVKNSHDSLDCRTELAREFAKFLKGPLIGVATITAYA